MSLNPSNLIATRTSPEQRGFPNLARQTEIWTNEVAPGVLVGGGKHVPLPEEQLKAVYEEVDNQTAKELAEAGITVTGLEMLRKHNGEVPTRNLGEFCRWGFHRAWYYWVAKGPGIPPDKAEEFNGVWKYQVRADGYAGGVPSIKEHFHGFAVEVYHIDTQEGLNAFAQLLKSIYRD